MLDKEYLKDDGSLDIARINSLPLFEHMHVISSMTQKQYEQYWCEYVSHLPVGNGPVQPVKVDHRIAEADRRGIEYDPKQVKLIDGIWCLGECPELDADMARDGSIYLKFKIDVNGEWPQEKMFFTVNEAKHIDENTILLQGMAESDTINGELTLLYETESCKFQYSDKCRQICYPLHLETWEILPDGAHNLQMLDKIKDLALSDSN